MADKLITAKQVINLLKNTKLAPDGECIWPDVSYTNYSNSTARVKFTFDKDFDVYKDKFFIHNLQFQFFVGNDEREYNGDICWIPITSDDEDTFILPNSFIPLIDQSKYEYTIGKLEMPDFWSPHNTFSIVFKTAGPLSYAGIDSFCYKLK